MWPNAKDLRVISLGRRTFKCVSSLSFSIERFPCGLDDHSGTVQLWELIVWRVQTSCSESEGRGCTLPPAQDGRCPHVPRTGSWEWEERHHLRTWFPHELRARDWRRKNGRAFEIGHWFKTEQIINMQKTPIISQKKIKEIQERYEKSCKWIFSKLAASHKHQIWLK